MIILFSSRRTNVRIFFNSFCFCFCFEIIRRSNSAVSDPTSTGERSSFCRQIHRLDPPPGRSDQTPLSFGGVILSSAIQLLSGDDRAFFVRSTALVGAIGTIIVWRGDTAISDPTSIGGRSGFYRQIHPWYERSDTIVVWRCDTAISDPTSIGVRSSFCRQIHHPGRSDQTPSSFVEVILPSAIQLLLEDDRAFAVRSIPWDDRAFTVRSTALVGVIGHLWCLEMWSDRAPSSFGGVILSSAIQLLSGDDRAFAVRSTALVEAIGHLHYPPSGRSDQAPSSFGGVILPSAIQLLSGDDQAFAVISTALVGMIGHHCRLESDPTSIVGRSGFCRQIHRPGRSDRAPSSFREVEAKLYHRRLLGEAKVELHRCRPLKATTY
ncbi:hypothetical protein E5676_scaffold648G001240 [Cucumis melo var. makuwa]|uniref:Uncharacterized protein n=1 Tax=Cucumis melo var. makuwa TaxID=1194695 RepID=A0A5A7U256_CUCMM|nr:hypothetical protein E6C27_scaffold115G001720 [Cucumis melo var. makuwa]TYK08326.1 hypothetical protein E5676_scaffold648G001240 [Cucumis melo var. makuwa]